MDHGETFRLLWYALFFLHARCVRSDVTCSAGNFTLGGPGSVRCNFGEVIHSKHNFNVVRYSGESSDSGDYVLLCNWAGTSLECTVKDGYAFDRQVDCSLTLAIAVVEERMAGMYVCQLVPDHGIPVHTCQLNVTAAIEQSTAAKKQPPSTPTEDPSPEHSSYLTYSIPAVAVLLLAVAGFPTGLLVFLRSRNISVRKGNNRDQESCVSKCCGRLCERVANCFKLPVPTRPVPVPTSNSDQLTSANTEEGQVLTGAGSETVDASTRGKGDVHTVEVGIQVTEDHLRQFPVSFTAVYVPEPPSAPEKPIDVRQNLPHLTKEPTRLFQPKRETTTDGGSSAQKKGPLPGGRKKEEEAEGLLGHNPKSTSERPEGTAEAERAHEEFVHVDVKDVEKLGAAKRATPEYKDEGIFRRLLKKI